MKLTLILYIFLTFSPLCLAAPSPILSCLAQEELALHKSKNIGPSYSLNQTLLNQIATIPNLEVSSKNITLICKNKNYVPSLSLLRLIILKGKNIFTIQKNVTGHALALNQLGTFVETSPHLLFTYLNEVQALMPYAHCLTDEIPEVKYFYDRYKYLEEHLNGDQLIEDKSKIDAIFKKINYIDQIIESCQLKAQQLDKEAKKKKI